MKRKVKKFAEGGTNVRTRTDEEFAEDSKFGGYGKYMPKTKSYSMDDVKSGLGRLLGGKSSPSEDRPTSSGVEDYASMGKRAGVVSPFSGAPSIKEESTTETATPSKSRSETIEEETVAGKGAKNLALEPEEIEVKKKTVVKKKPKYKDTGAKIGSQGDFKMNFPASESSSGMGPRNTFLTRERLEKSKGIFSRMKSGGKVSSASSRGDGIAQRGKTKGRIC